MRRALYLVPKLPYPPVDGGRIVSWNLARCLRHNGYEVDLVSFARSRDQVVEHRAALHEVFRTVSTRVKDVQRQYASDLARALVTRSSYFVRKYRSRALARILDRKLAENDYDLTVLESAYMGVYAPEIAARADRSGHVLLRLQNVEFEIFERLARFETRPPLRRLLRRETILFRAFEQQLYRRIGDIRAITDRDAENATRLAERPIGVLDATIDADRYAPGDASDVEPQSVVSIGDLSWRPNRNGVLWFHKEVWSRVVQRHPEAHYYIVGSHPPPEVRALESAHTIVTGFVEDDAAFFRKAHVLAVPLFEGSGVRIKILMALAMGKAVLSTTVGAEGIRYDGVRRRDDADGWIEAITQAFDADPAIDRSAVDYVHRRHHWRRTVDFEAAGAST